MIMTILGRKVGMTQIFDEAGIAIPITVIDTSDCAITQIKRKETDGYCALQVGVGSRKPQAINKAISGHLAKASVSPKAHIQEIRLADDADLTGLEAGQHLQPEMFEKGDLVDVSGITIGKGFAGVMKRHGFHGKPATHGTSKHFRHGGSIGTATYPGRVMKNKKMPGQMGNTLRTQLNIKVVDIRPEDNLILLRGGIPGPKNAYVSIRHAIKKAVPQNRAWTKEQAKGNAPEKAEEAPQDQ